MKKYRILVYPRTRRQVTPLGHIYYKPVGPPEAGGIIEARSHKEALYFARERAKLLGIRRALVRVERIWESQPRRKSLTIEEMDRCMEEAINEDHLYSGHGDADDVCC